MNEHLQPVFEILLPALEGAGIKYWVYGGVGIAGVVGEFFRPNGDVDIFVEERDFVNATSLLDNICKQNGLTPKDRGRLNGRPKFEVIDEKVIDKEKREILSVVPVYRKDGHVEFVFGPRPTRYSDQMLASAPRNIGRYRFPTPADKYIKELFKTLVRNRRKVKTKEKIWENIQRDAQKILTLEECRELKIPELMGGVR